MSLIFSPCEISIVGQDLVVTLDMLVMMDVADLIELSVNGSVDSGASETAMLAGQADYVVYLVAVVNM